MKWPQGVRSAGVTAGIKGGGTPDVGVIVLSDATSWAGTFTRNAAAAGCVQWCKQHLGKKVRVLVVNSGNANACTGPAGERAVITTAEAAAGMVGCDAAEVLVSSTGPIGVTLPVDKLTASLPGAFASVTEEMDGFAEAILTTDTIIKTAEARAGAARVVGVAKGAAMLAPNMATMLAFLATDAQVEGPVLQSCLSHAVERSFNRISIDACESTNDSVLLFATGSIPVSASDLEAAVEAVCMDLARQMIADAEGGSRVVQIQVTGASDEQVAADLGRAVAASALWRSAVHGADPNWGRIVAALGSADRSLSLSDVSIAIGSETLFDHGVAGGSTEAARKVMETDAFTVSCIVGSGPGSAEVLSCDLSPAYVELNAGGLT